MHKSLAMETVFMSLSRGELQDLIAETVTACLRHNPSTNSIVKNSKHVYGINGLARLLDCSRPTAQRLKNSGKVPFTQAGRKIVFDTDAVLSALNKKEAVK